MKKILLFICIVISVNGIGQGFPGTQSMANANTRLVINGGLEAVRGLINGVFTDTTAANADKIDFYNGAQIWTRSDRNFWLRDSVLNMWIRIAKFSEVSGATPGGSDKQVQYNNAGAFGGSAGFETALTNLRAKITAQATTEIPLELKLASSQTANAFNVSSSAGTGDLGSWNASGYLQAIRGGFGGSASYPIHVYGGSDANARGPLYVTGNSGTVGVGVSLDAVGNGGNLWSLFSAGSGASAPAGAWAIYNGSVTGYRMSQKNSGEYAIGQDFFDYNTMLNVKSYSTAIDVARFHGFEDDDAVIGLWADEGDDNADKWFIASNKTSNAFTLTNNTTKYLEVTSDGRLYGTALHNNAGAVTGTTNQYIASGTQTPGATNVTNVASSTPGMEQWTRVGNVVTVSGFIQIDCTTASISSQIDLALPIASSFTNTTQLSGVMLEAVTGVASPSHGTISSNDTDDRVTILFTPRVDTNLNYRYTYTYQIL